jgi:curved DNA-binding protein CbpA
MKHVNDMAAAINEARDLLLDKKAREVYDKTGKKGDQAVKDYEAMRNMQNMYNGAGYSAPRGFGRRGNGYR